jgi:hypothetical protein
VGDIDLDESAGLTADLFLTATPWDADAVQLHAHDVIEPLTTWRASGASLNDLFGGA